MFHVSIQVLLCKIEQKIKIEDTHNVKEHSGHQNTKV